MAADGALRSGGQAGKAAALARLLHQECVRLLELYREKESLPSLPDSGGRVVSVSALTTHLSSEERLRPLRAALLSCLRLLERLIQREDAELPEGEESEYRKQRNTVKVRLEHMLSSTERLLTDSSVSAASVTQILDPTDGGTFALKKWTLQLLQDLVHWSSQMSETLQMMLTETEKASKTAGRVTRRQKRRLR